MNVRGGLLVSRGPSPARGLVALLLVALSHGLGVGGCSVLVSPEELSEGCPHDQKACGGVCVSRADPEYGCDGQECYPCLIPQATARCNAQGACVAATCRGRFADCNDDGDIDGGDGCETDTAHDPEHCGGCDAPACEVPNATPGCAGGHCSISRCKSGFRDCNADAHDGCEVEADACP